MSRPFETLCIPSELFEQMLAHARNELPLECCGLLAGLVESGAIGRVTECYPLVNSLASAIAFESEPRGMFEATRDMRRRGLEILAVYHSHPTSEPKPSRADIDRNYSEDMVNLILSLRGEPAEVRGWWLGEHGCEEAAWRIVTTEGAI